MTTAPSKPDMGAAPADNRPRGPATSPPQPVTTAPASGPIAALAQPVSDQSARYLNRELQWLEFNDRVLYQAVDDRVPLLERARFLAIHASNLDEFFMKRVGGLRRQLAAGVGALGPEGVSPARQLEAIRQRLLPMTQVKADCYRNQIVPALRAQNIHLLSYGDLTKAEARNVNEWYRKSVFPILTPLAVDPGHRFPFISNLSVSLGVMLRRPGETEQLFARVKVPRMASQWCRVNAGAAPGDGLRFVALVDVIENNLSDLFPGMEILKVLPFRVTRNADVLDDMEDAEDLLDQIQQQLRERRFAPVVRLQIGRKPNKRLLSFLCEEMEISPHDIYETQGLIDYTSLNEIADLEIPALRFRPWTPVVPPRLANPGKDLFSVIREGDVLLHHPYESFDASVERFIEEAAADPAVLGIKMALYRTSGDSPFVRELVHAAETGKQVAVLVELRARFDEERNIGWARKLEDAGVHVAYGVVGLKTHTKIALVVRREADGLRSYVHASTGNYNSRTAGLYEDIGLLTSDPLLCDDVVDLFNSITGRCRQPQFNKLIVAPHYMKRRFIELIDREAALHAEGKTGQGRIVAKMNQLQDQEVTEALYRASQTGVKIDLIVRGFCTLRPGVPGMSDNIRVMSVIGRFLEHSRIFYFRNGREDPRDSDFYTSSADWMYRNLHLRVEAACPVEDRTLRARLWHILTICLNDQRQCWDMQADGSYRMRRPDGLPENAPEALGTHQALMNFVWQQARKEQDVIEGEWAAE